MSGQRHDARFRVLRLIVPDNEGPGFFLGNEVPVIRLFGHRRVRREGIGHAKCELGLAQQYVRSSRDKLLITIEFQKKIRRNLGCVLHKMDKIGNWGDEYGEIYIRLPKSKVMPAVALASINPILQITLCTFAHSAASVR